MVAEVLKKDFQNTEVNNEVNQHEGNDGGGSNCSNTPSLHHQDLCPG